MGPGRKRVERRIHIETRARLQGEIAFDLRFGRRAGGEIRFQAWIVVDRHVHAIVREVRELGGIDRTAARDDRRVQVASGFACGELGIRVVSDGFRVEHVEARGGTGDVTALAVVGERDRVQLVLLGLVENPRLPPEVLVHRVIDETPVGVQARRVRFLVEARAARILQRERGIDPGLLQDLSRALVRDGHDVQVCNQQPRMVRIGYGRRPDRHVNQDAVGVERVVPQIKLVRLPTEVVHAAHGLHQAGIQVDVVDHLPADGLRAPVADQDLPVLSARGGVDQRAQLPVVEALVSLGHGRNLPDLHGR